MQFEQQSIFKNENSIMELNPFAFSIPNREGVVPGVYPLVDYLTVMFKDCCVMDALNWLGLQDAVSDIYKSLKPVYGMDPKFAFSYNGIRIDVSRVFFYYDAEDLEEETIAAIKNKQVAYMTLEKKLTQNLHYLV